MKTYYRLSSSLLVLIFYTILIQICCCYRTIRIQQPPSSSSSATTTTLFDYAKNNFDNLINNYNNNNYDENDDDDDNDRQYRRQIRSPSSSSLSSLPSPSPSSSSVLPYDNLYDNCLKEESKRLPNFDHHHFCNSTESLLRLRTHLQQSICAVANYTSDIPDAMKRSFRHRRSLSSSSSMILFPNLFGKINDNYNYNGNEYDVDGYRIKDNYQRINDNNDDDDDDDNQSNDPLGRSFGYDHDHRRRKRHQLTKRKSGDNIPNDTFKKIFEYMANHLNLLSLLQENYSMGKNPKSLNNNNNNKARNINSKQPQQDSITNADHHYGMKAKLLKKLEHLEDVLHRLKNDIIKKLIHISQCKKFKHECHRLQPPSTSSMMVRNNNNNDRRNGHDTGSLARLNFRFGKALTNYRDHLIDALKLLSPSFDIDQIKNGC